MVRPHLEYCSVVWIESTMTETKSYWKEFSIASPDFKELL